MIAASLKQDSAEPQEHFSQALPGGEADGDGAAPPLESTGKATPRNLSPVLAVIPRACYDNPTWKGMLYAARDTLVYAAILTGLALTDSGWLLVPLWILSAFIVSGLFILGHDAAHGALFKSKRLNGVMGRLLMLPSLHVYESWVFGHNRLHHGHTARQGADFVWHPITRKDWDALSPLQRVLVRFEWSWLGAGVYYARNIWFKMIRYQQPDSLAKKVHRDQVWVGLFALAMTVGMIALGWQAYGTVAGAAWMWLKVFVIPVVLFMYSIGLTVYVHHIAPDIRWYPRGSWDKFKGQMESTTIAHMPLGLDFFFHNIMVHVPHHVDMRIPFYHLPKAAKAIVAAYPDVVREGRMSLVEYFRITRVCKLYDFEAGRWGPYPSKKRTEASPA
jgi:acyl-lipid omega-6 desaturase (Delta-12 desaturase)